MDQTFWLRLKEIGFQVNKTPVCNANILKGGEVLNSFSGDKRCPSSLVTPGLYLLFKM